VWRENLSTEGLKKSPENYEGVERFKIMAKRNGCKEKWSAYK